MHTHALRTVALLLVAAGLAGCTVPGSVMDERNAHWDRVTRSHPESHVFRDLTPVADRHHQVYDDPILRPEAEVGAAVGTAAMLPAAWMVGALEYGELGDLGGPVSMHLLRIGADGGALAATLPTRMWRKARIWSRERYERLRQAGEDDTPAPPQWRDLPDETRPSPR